MRRGGDSHPRASNSEIAAELFLGVETVRTHVRNIILAKLGVRDRVQADIAAYESGFVD